MNIKSFWMLFLIFCATNLQLVGQEESEFEEVRTHKWIGEIYFAYGNPIGVFADNMEKGLKAFDGSVFYQPVYNSPLFLGLDFHFGNFDSKRVLYDEFIDGFLQSINENSSVSQIGADAVARFYFPIPLYWIQIYIEGNIGGRYLYTATTLSDQNSDMTFDSYTNLKDWGYAYGLAGGFNIPFGEYTFGSFKLKYTTTNSMNYYAENTGDNVGAFYPIEFFDQFNSTVDLLFFQFGLTFSN